MSGPFHHGEIYMHERLGFAEQTARVGEKFIRPQMPDQHRDFFEQLPFIFIGAVDETGHPWASVLTGPEGFINTPSASDMLIYANLPENDPLHGHLTTRAKVGMIGIEPQNRRRNRANGTVINTRDHKPHVQIDQSFGNCPKYIQRRVIRIKQGDGLSYTCDTLCRDLRSTIKNADIFFIASRSQDLDDDSPNGVDMSHRGGERGFVKVIDEHRLSFADYPGNKFFNTLGNITTDNRVGLLFLDFDKSRLLHVKASAEIEWIQNERNTIIHVDHVLVRCLPTLISEDIL